MIKIVLTLFLAIVPTAAASSQSSLTVTDLNRAIEIPMASMWPRDINFS